MFKKRSVFIRILIPLLLLVILQSVLVSCAMLMGGTVDLLRSNSRRIVIQNLQNRQISLENDMVQHWSNLDECVKIVCDDVNTALKDSNKTLIELQNEHKSKELLNSLSEHLLYTMRKNSVTGAFLVLSNGKDFDYPTKSEDFQGVYFRDLDPATNPSDYSDVLMERGPASVAENYHITLDTLWREEYDFVPPAIGGSSMDYYFQPYLAAHENIGMDFRNLGRWSEPFLLSANSQLDSQGIITYSLPLIGEDNIPFGVLGVEISLDMFYERMPSREIDTFNRGGYMLVTYNQNSKDLLCIPQVVSGNAMKQLTRGENGLQLEELNDGLYKLNDLEQFGNPVYAGLLNLELYNSNTPFSKQQWALVALINEEALYGIADNLEHSVLFATLGSLFIGIICVYFVASHTTRPLSRAAQQLRETGPEKLAENSTGIFEVDELFQVIRELNRKQKSVESDLKNERERYLLALESTTDIILEYDCIKDTLLIYHLEKTNGISHVSTNAYSHFRLLIEAGGAIHPDDKIQMLNFIDGESEEVIIRCESAINSGAYRWFSAKGKSVYNDERNLVRIIGSTRDITAEKETERLLYESDRRDALTSLYKREIGEVLIQQALLLWPNGCLAILDMDSFERLNEQCGLLYCDLLLETISATLLKSAMPDDVLVRYGGDEFLIYFAHRNETQALEFTRQICHRVTLLNAGDKDINISCSIGIACYGTYDSLLERAIKTLEYAKAHYHANAASYTEIAQIAGKEWVNASYKPRKIDRITSLYYKYDENIVSLAFNLFEKTSDIKIAAPMLLSKLARHYNLRKAAVLSADLDFYTSRVDYQWVEYGQKHYDTKPEHYSAKTFHTLIGIYAKQNIVFANTLDRENRKMLKWTADFTTLCCPMYDNGRYIGSTIFQSDKNQWTQEDIELVKEIVKLLSAHISKSRADLASRAKSEFLSRMSHEIRTPMNAIMGMTNIALCLPQLSDKTIDCLQKIDSSAHYLLSLLNDILDMSKIESGKMELSFNEFDLTKLLQNIDILMRPQAESKSLNFILKNQFDEHYLIGDSLRLNQIIVNLLSNAIKFTNVGRDITVTTQQISQEENKVGIRFSVKDTGIGINSNHIERIFNAFEQEENSTASKYGGTGLGLSISSNLVRMMGGKLEVNTIIGKGSEFYFTVFFDICDGNQLTEIPEHTKSFTMDFKGKHILLVEDNDLNIEIAHEILNMSGFDVTEARDGQVAVETFKQSAIGYYDAILMDIRMPVMDGLEATRIIRQLHRKDAVTVPIIAMTANAFDEDMKKSIESGMNGHLAKPFEIKKLMEILSSLIPIDT